MVQCKCKTPQKRIFSRCTCTSEEILVSYVHNSVSSACFEMKNKSLAPRGHVRKRSAHRARKAVVAAHWY